MNCYEPGAHDYRHANPGSEHTFLVWKGKLRLTGVKDGEDLTLRPGEFVQIQAGYRYRLHKPGAEPAVYCQFQTIPTKPPKRGTVLFGESRRGKAAAQKRRGVRAPSSMQTTRVSPSITKSKVGKPR